MLVSLTRTATGACGRGWLTSGDLLLQPPALEMPLPRTGKWLSPWSMSNTTEWPVYWDAHSAHIYPPCCQIPTAFWWGMCSRS